MSFFRAALAVQVITAFFFGYFHDLVAINGPVDAPTAGHLTSLFLECVVAPVFEPAAQGMQKRKVRDFDDVRWDFQLATTSEEAV